MVAVAATLVAACAKGLDTTKPLLFSQWTRLNPRTPRSDETRLPAQRHRWRECATFELLGDKKPVDTPEVSS